MSDLFKEVPTKEPKDLRYRKQFFPDAENLVFDTRGKGFVPLPIVLRKLIRHLTVPELRFLIYLQLRASKYGICYPTIDGIVHELGLTSKKNLLPHLESLEEKKFISTAASGARRFFLVRDLRVPIAHLVEQKKIDERELFEIDDLLKDLGQGPIMLVPHHGSTQHHPAARGGAGTVGRIRPRLRGLTGLYAPQRAGTSARVQQRSTDMRSTDNDNSTRSPYNAASR